LTDLPFRIDIGSKGLIPFSGTIDLNNPHDRLAGAKFMKPLDNGDIP
jgi:hypothetical protein